MVARIASWVMEQCMLVFDWVLLARPVSIGFLGVARTTSIGHNVTLCLSSITLGTWAPPFTLGAGAPF